MAGLAPAHPVATHRLADVPWPGIAIPWPDWQNALTARVAARDNGHAQARWPVLLAAGLAHAEVRRRRRQDAQKERRNADLAAAGRTRDPSPRNGPAAGRHPDRAAVLTGSARATARIPATDRRSPKHSVTWVTGPVAGSRWRPIRSHCLDHGRPGDPQSPGHPRLRHWCAGRPVSQSVHWVLKFTRLVTVRPGMNEVSTCRCISTHGRQS